MANIFVAVLMIGVGYLIGFRFGGTLLEAIASPAIAILFALPVAGLFAAIGLIARSAESVNVIGFVAIFPITFISSAFRSEEHTSELQSLMRISYAVFCLKKKT